MTQAAPNRRRLSTAFRKFDGALEWMELHSLRRVGRSNMSPNLRIGVLRPISDGYDHIEVASNSFPASDLPGWIEARAHPCADGDASAAEECLEETAKGAERAATR
jgi:hypothetical protein